MDRVVEIRIYMIAWIFITMEKYYFKSRRAKSYHICFVAIKNDDENAAYFK